MSMNIDKFDEYTALLLAGLYKNFPLKVDYYWVDFYPDVALDDMGEPKDARDKKLKEIWLATLDWLVEAGYIKSFEARPYYGHLQCVLTAKALEILKKMPESLQGVPESLGDRLLSLGTRVGSDAMRQTVVQILSHGAKMGMG